MKRQLIFSLVCCVFFSCKNNDSNDIALPYLGNKKIEGGKEVNHSIRSFAYVNQDSVTVTNESLKDVVYVADFFFTSCPSICPIVARNMLTIYSAFENNPQVKLVSFTLDPKRDTPTKLTKYANNLEVKSSKWLFLTGDKDFTLELAHDYFVSAAEDAGAPGGFNHSGKLILVDKTGHIRSYCEGTDAKTIPKFIEDINKLLKEYK